MSRKEYPSYPVKASGGVSEKDLPSHVPEVEWHKKGGGNVSGGSRRSDERTLPWYGWVGMASLLAGEAGLFLDAAPIRTFFFGIAWWSYILVADACVWRRCGASLLRSRPREFWFLAFWSIPLWNLFELLNFRLQNWFYVNAPANQTLALLFNVISYATVLPALFETYLLLGAYGAASGIRVRPWRIAPVGLVGSAILGLGMVIAPLAWPRVAFPLIWGFAIFLGEPLCYWAGTRTVSLARQLERGDPRPFLRLLLAGFVCGGLWEFWNFWAYTKWLYTVPHLEALKWFEMPPLGFLGFPAFAVACYVLVNLLNVIRRGRSWESPAAAGRGAPLGIAVPAIALALAFNGITYAGIDRWTVKSVAPTLAAMEGVPGDVVERLGRSGVSTPPALLRRTAMPERVAQLSRQSQVPEAELQRLRAGAALVELKGLGAANYNALRRLGIFTIEDLAQRVPTVLLPRWRAAVAERPPSLAQVTLWIRAARRQTGLAPPQPSAFAHRGYGSTTHN